MFQMEFYTDAFQDFPEILAENVNSIGGKGLMQHLRAGFADAGYTCSDVDAEDWGWYFLAEKNNTRYLCGGQVGSGPEEDSSFGQEWASAFVDHDRGFFDKILGRNKADPADRSADLLQKLLKGCPNISRLEAG